MRRLKLMEAQERAVTLKEIKEKLFKAGIETADFDASVLIEHFEGKNRASQFAFPEREYTSEGLLAAVEKRMLREPLQYIIGEWDFMGYTFKVSPDCLIPRADTELLCGIAEEKLQRGGRFADLCTGSGCIAVSILLDCPDTEGVAVDLYPKTLEICRENAKLHNVEGRLETVLADVTVPCLEGEFDVIVSNPPYVTAEEMLDISAEVSLEPVAALTDGGDGLSIIRKILEIYPAYLKDGGILAIEFGWKQGDAVLEIARGLGLKGNILKDSENRDRVIVIKK